MKIAKLFILLLGFVGINGRVPAETVFENLDEPHNGGGFWNDGPEDMSAQPFQLGNHNTVTSVTLGLFGRGQPNGTIYLDLYDSDDGKPGALIGSLGTLDPMTVATGVKANYQFDTPVTGLTPEETYHLVLSNDGTNWRDGADRGVRVFWSLTSQTGQAGVGQGMAIDPRRGVADWHTIADYPTGGPPFPVWFYASVDAALDVSSEGDFDGDGLLTAADIDALVRVINEPSPNAKFDLNHDGIVDLDDQHYWVQELKQTWMGDSNLDGEFNSSDLTAVFQAGKYELDEESGWAEGDWTGDGRFDTSDLTEAFQDGGYEQGLRTDAVSVPEPSCRILMILGLLGIRRIRKR